MKKQIFTLVEKNDKFLMVKRKDDKCIWELPGGDVLTSASDKEALKESIYNKFSICIDVKDFIYNSKTEEGDVIVKFFSSKFISGIISSDDYCEYKYFSLQEILFLKMDELSKKLIEKLNGKIVMEIVNDAFWLRLLILFKKDLNDYSQKEFITTFILLISSIFVAETLLSGYGGIKRDEFTKKQILDCRNMYLKLCPTIESSNCKKIIDEMGINFNEYVFDMYLVFSNDDLIDCNLRNWENNKLENFDFLDGIASTPRRWIEILMPELSDVFDRLLNDYLESRRLEMNKIKFVKKSYSFYRIFKKSNLDNSDKLYILYRYGLIKSLLYIDDFFKESLTIKFSNSTLFDMKRFIRKSRAIVIEIIWNDYKTNNLKILNEIFELNKNDIKIDSFYIINRKCRDNLHYGNYRTISDKENRILDVYQRKYLENVLMVFNKYLYINFGFFYRLGYGIAKLTYVPKK